GDIGAAALLAKSDALSSAKMTLFHPFAFMLAQPEEDPAEIVAALGDGEIVAYRDRILPFAIIQKRLGRRKVTDKLREEAPVVFFAFDLLYLDGEPLFEMPLRERLAKMPHGGAIRLSDSSEVRDAAHVDELFDAARARANEGLVVKDPDSIYTPGRRGKSWLKYKKALATLDCVVTAAEYGHGKRRAV